MKQKTVTISLIILALLIIFAVVMAARGKMGNKLVDDPLVEPTEIQEANVTDIEVAILESFPVQVNVTAYAEAPDGCTTIREVIREREEQTFTVTILTERPIDAMCTQAITVLEETFPLDVDNLLAGEYTVLVNGLETSFTLDQDNLVEFDAGTK